MKRLLFEGVKADLYNRLREHVVYTGLQQYWAEF